MSELNLKPITITIDNGLKLSGLGRTKFYQLINEGTIKTITIGRRRLVVYSSLEALTNAA
jgi:predicted DNA-binding transcriptional regulator AlpA